MLAVCAEGEDAQADGSKTPASVLKAVMAEIESEDVVIDDDESLQHRLGQLDLLLTWLWRVHGIDYYGGKELLLEAEYDERRHVNRTVRGQRPEEGEEQDEVEGRSELSVGLIVTTPVMLRATVGCVPATQHRQNM